MGVSMKKRKYHTRAKTFDCVTINMIRTSQELPRDTMTQPLMQESPNHTIDAISHSTNVNPSTVFHDRTRHSQIAVIIKQIMAIFT